MFYNITKKEREALKEIKTWKNCCERVQDKDSRFVVISNDKYWKKVNTQIKRRSFTQLPYYITESFENKINDFIVKFSIKNGLAISNLTIVNLEQCIG